MNMQLTDDYTFHLDGIAGLSLLADCKAAVARSDSEMDYAEPAGITRQGDAAVALFCSRRWRVLDHVSPAAPGIARLERTWTYTGEKTFAGQLCLELATEFDPEWYLIPCVSYNGNHEGRGQEPKGLDLDGKNWLFSYERVSLPSATFTEREGFCSGLFAGTEDEPSLISSCGLRRQGRRLVHRIFRPEVEEPLVYADTNRYEAGFAHEITLSAGQSFKAVNYIYLCAGEPVRTGWFGAYRYFFEHFTQPFSRRFTCSELWRLNLDYLLEWLWVDDGDFVGFNIGLLPDGEYYKGAPGRQWKQRASRRYEIGWAGQNYANAWILMQDAISCGNPDSFARAVRMFDLWEQQARAENGLFEILFDRIQEDRRDTVVDTCNLGWGALMAMEGYVTAREMGIDKPRWLDMGLSCCNFFVNAWATQGTFGKSWKILTGECVNKSGTVGSFMLMPMVRAWTMTGDRRYLDCAEQAFRFYAARDLDNMTCFAGALDTDCVDCETCYPLLNAAIRLYEATGDGYYLACAVKAAKYIASWIYLYDVKSDDNSDFALTGYRTTGGGAVSTQHHHIHNGTLYFIKEWLRLSELTGDGLWRKYARLVWAATQQMISDGTLTLHGMVRPKGSEHEAYLQCRWCVSENDGRRHFIADWLVIWPQTFRLLCLTGPDREKIMQALDASAKDP